MVRTDEILDPAVIVGHDACAAVLAGVEEGGELAVRGSRDENGLVSDVEDAVVAGFREIPFKAGKEPRAAPDALVLRGEPIGRHVPLWRDRGGCEWRGLVDDSGSGEHGVHWHLLE